MAGYAAGFSGLESFSPSSSVFLLSPAALSPSILSLARIHPVSFSFSPFPSNVSLGDARRKSRKGNARSEEESKALPGKMERERNKLFAVLRGTGNVRPRQDPFNIADAALLARNEACRDESPEETQAIAISFRQRSLLARSFYWIAF